MVPVRRHGIYSVRMLDESSEGRELTRQLVQLEVGNQPCCFKQLLMPAKAVGSYSTSREVSPSHLCEEET